MPFIALSCGHYIILSPYLVGITSSYHLILWALHPVQKFDARGHIPVDQLPIAYAHMTQGITGKFIVLQKRPRNHMKANY